MSRICDDCGAAFSREQGCEIRNYDRNNQRTFTDLCIPCAITPTPCPVCGADITRRDALAHEALSLGAELWVGTQGRAMHATCIPAALEHYLASLRELAP